MKRKNIVITAAVASVLLVIIISAWGSYKATYASFECDRKTFEIRPTDKYCQSFSNYLLDFVSFRIER